MAYSQTDFNLTPKQKLDLLTALRDKLKEIREQQDRAEALNTSS